MTSTYAPPAFGIPADRVGNPHDVPLAADRVLGARHDIPGYGETAFLSCWDDTSHTGVYLHIGRCPQDLELFWAHVAVYLPDGSVAVDRSWGRPADDHSLATANLRIGLERPHRGWTVTYDGAAQRTTPEQMATGIVGAGPARPLTFRIDTEPAGPVWDLYAGLRPADGRPAERQDWAQGTHTQQAFRHQGQVTYDGQTHSLNGFGGSDHSSGPRHLTNIGGDLLLIAGWPDRVLHHTHTLLRDGTVALDTASILRPDGSHETVTVHLPHLATAPGEPGRFDITVTDSRGDSTVISAEVVAAAPFTLTDDNDNLNGVDPGGPDHLILNEARLRLTLPDGTIGAAYLERGRRLSCLA